MLTHTHMHTVAVTYTVVGSGAAEEGERRVAEESGDRGANSRAREGSGSPGEQKRGDDTC